MESIELIQQPDNDPWVAELADVIFCSPLQPSQHPNAQALRDAVLHTLRRENDALAECAAYVAYHYGDHPDESCARMRWARAMVIGAFRGRVTAA